MARAITRIKPPFSWLGPYTTSLGLAGTVLLAAVFRFWQLDQLSPGLASHVAASALGSLRLIEHGTLPGFSASNNFAPAWVVLQALPIKLFGATPLSLKLWPAILGTLAVVTTWLWLNNWFGRRIAWIGSLIIAAIPWTVTFSRNGYEIAALPLLVSLAFWLATIAWKGGKPVAWAGFVSTMIVSLFFGPLGWALVGIVAIFGSIQVIHDRRASIITKGRFVTAVFGLAGLIAWAIVAAGSLKDIQKLPELAHVTFNPVTVFNNAAATFLMIFGPNAGDGNYQHNLAGQPILNVFLGLMFVAGLLVSISRLQHRRYRWVLGAWLLLLFPAIVTSSEVPNSARVIAAAPAIAALAAIGTSYMLELWYATFPINSAARSGGQAAVLVLLGLSVYLSYTQYFRAWGQMSEVYNTSNYDVVRMASNLKTEKLAAQHFAVIPADQRDVFEYINHNGPKYTALDPQNITGLPTDAGARQFLMTPENRDAAMKLIKAKYPGGVLRPHYSLFNQTEIYYSYETTK